MNVSRKLKMMALALLVVASTIGLFTLHSSPAVAATDTDNSIDPAQFARGAQTWADNCARCHNMRDAKSLRDDQWRAAVAHMRVRANLTRGEAADVLAFLQRSN